MPVSDESFQALTARVDELERQGRAWIHLDRDVAALQAQRDADRRILQTIADTQADHTRILGDHTRILGDHTRVLGDHTRVLEDHTRILTEHTRVLEDHTRILEDHTQRLDRLERRVDEGFAATSASLAQIMGMLQRLQPPG